MTGVASGVVVVHTEAHRGHRTRELHNGEMIDGFERPERADVIAAALREAGHEFVEPDAVDRDLLARVHTSDYVELLESAWDRWRDAGHTASAAMGFAWPTRGVGAHTGVDRRPDDIVGLLGRHSFSADSSIVEGTWTAVSGSAAVATAAADRCMTSGVAYGLCRPPGHHAGRDQFGGYCYLNNAAIAAQRLRDGGVERVGILDVDYHHGNGTQEIFYERDDVRFASIHADPVEEFPWFTGFADETGIGAGEGHNLNVALPRGSDRASWFDGLGSTLEWLAGVDALVVSLGVDAYVGDPLGTFALTTDDFHLVAGRIRALGVPTAIVQEGGYEAPELGDNVAGFLAAWA